MLRSSHLVRGIDPTGLANVRLGQIDRVVNNHGDRQNVTVAIDQRGDRGLGTADSPSPGKKTLLELVGGVHQGIFVLRFAWRRPLICSKCIIRRGWATI